MKLAIPIIKGSSIPDAINSHQIKEQDWIYKLGYTIEVNS